MRFMLIREADKETEASILPAEQLVGDMMKYNEEMVRVQAGANRK